MTEEKQRIKYLDVLKFFGIFLMLMQHAGNEITFSGGYTVLKTWICSFHMSLFFWAYGAAVERYNLKEPKKRRQFFCGFIGLGFAYVGWGLIYKTSADFVKLIMGMAYGSNLSLTYAGTNAVLWFLPTFMVAKILYQLMYDIVFLIENKIIKTESKKIEYILQIFIAGIYCFISVLLGRKTKCFSVVSNFGYPLAFDVGFTGAALMIAGHILRPLLEMLNKKLKAFSRILLAGTFIVAAMILVQYNVPVDTGFNVAIMAYGQYGKSYVFYFLFACISICAMTIIAKMCENIRAMNWLGQNTLVIMAVHYIVFIITIPITRFMFNWLEAINVSVISILLSIVCASLTCLFCVPMILVVKYFVPVLGGKIGYVAKDK